MASRAASQLRADFASSRQPNSQLRADIATPRQANARVRSSAAASAKPDPRGRTHLAHYLKHPTRFIVPFVFSVALVGSLAAGWVNRHEGHLTPEKGLGYWLGIAGAGAMLLLLLYPFRKRMKMLRLIGGVAFWFRTHMVLGLVGPALILFHSNFQLGSLNSNVALFTMLTVAGSGVVGRYLYRHIHRGLYGRKTVVNEILVDVVNLRRLFGDEVPDSERIVAQLDAFTKLALAPRTGALTGFWWMWVLNLRGRSVRRRLSADIRWLIKREGKRRGWSWRMRRERLAAALELITLHLAAVRKAAAFAFYERLFALWHVLHLPLFILLVLATVIHVIAVHFY